MIRICEDCDTEMRLVEDDLWFCPGCRSAWLLVRRDDTEYVLDEIGS